MTGLLLLAFALPQMSALSNSQQPVGREIPDGLGYHICPLNDVDGDKCADFAIDDGCETAWLISGKTAEVLATIRALDVPGLDAVRQVQLVPLRGDLDADGHWDLLDLGNGVRQPRLARSGRDLHSLGREFGVSPTSDWYRMERQGIGDWDGDGTPDLITPDAPDQQAGLLVLSGRTGSRLEAFHGLEFARKHCLCCGDYDHDGKTEAHVADGTGWNAFILGGCAEEPLATLQDDGQPPTPADEEEMTCAAAFVPDQDGDGRDDVLFVRPLLGMWTDAEASRVWHGAHPSCGKALIRSSSTGKLLRGLNETLAMSECDSAAVANLSDIDRDGVPDFAVAYDRFWGEGRVIVYSGRTVTTIREHSGTRENLGDPGAFGVAVAGIGDTDGDGVGDYLVGASGGVDFAGPGCVTLYSGADGHVLHAIWKRDLEKK